MGNRRIRKKHKQMLEEVLTTGILEAQKRLSRAHRLYPGRCLLLIMNNIKTVEQLFQIPPAELRKIEPSMIDDEFIENIRTMCRHKIFNGSVPAHWKN